MKCERCWSEDGVGDLIVAGSNKSGRNVELGKIHLCHSCRAAAPREPLLLQKLFLRFASKKELLQHYGVNAASDALVRWCTEMGITLKEAEALLSQEPVRLGLFAASDMSSLQPPTRQPPYGYKIQEGSLIPSPSESSVVLSVFDKYLEGETLEDIAQWLNRSRVPTRKDKTWHRSTVRYLLRNPLYAGYQRRNGVLRKSSHPGLLEPSLFEKTQGMLAERCRRPDQRVSAISLDTG